MKTPLQNQTIWFGFSAQTCTPLIGTVTFIKMSQTEPSMAAAQTNLVPVFNQCWIFQETSTFLKLNLFLLYVIVVDLFMYQFIIVIGFAGNGGP